jgi:hypothetical protein
MYQACYPASNPCLPCLVYGVYTGPPGEPLSIIRDASHLCDSRLTGFHQAFGSQDDIRDREMYILPKAGVKGDGVEVPPVAKPFDTFLDLRNSACLQIKSQRFSQKTVPPCRLFASTRPQFQ